MLMDDYITHLLESKLEKEDEKVYSDRLQQMKKGIHNRPLITRTKYMYSSWKQATFYYLI